MLTTSPTVDGIVRAAIATTDELLRTLGSLQPPTMHILCEDMDQPYVGYLTCRPFRRGKDAEAAITEMGALASALLATRIVVTWEHQDLMVALDRPGDHPNAVAVWDVDMGGDDTFMWHPFTIDFGRGGVARAVEWGESARYSGRDVTLPESLIMLRAVWRKAAPPDLAATVEQLERAGYRMRWTQPS